MFATRLVRRLGGLAGLLAALASACSDEDELDSVPPLVSAPVPSEALPALPAFNPRLLRRFKPLRTALADGSLPEARVELGRMLYYEPRLSKSQELSCNSCHPLDRYGVDNLPTSRGHEGVYGRRNAPSTYLAAAAFRQFWDGRVEDVERQAVFPILNPSEMAAESPSRVESALATIPAYRAAFEHAFPGEASPVTLRNVGMAIAAFERGLTTPGRWDDYLTGNRAALTESEVEGLRVFTNVGCMVCHTGELVGGSMYQKLGSVEPWPNQSDRGRFEVTREATDEMVFKVPSLRNVDKTAPYFHDGSAATLDDAVMLMGRHQLGLELSATEVRAIGAWLRTLTGRIPTDYIARPELPPAADGSRPRLTP
jgi:cytochrome c peroxidase